MRKPQPQLSVVALCMIVLNYIIRPASTGSPLSGSKQKMPASSRRAGGSSLYDYYKQDLTRLLDVGACLHPSDSTISFVPPLDGTSPDETLCQSNYSMKMVLFDLQLVELKAVDAIGGSFRAQLQLVLHWVDSTIEGSNGTIASENCSFLCDTNSPTDLCCDEVWVPPLGLPRCEINEIQSSTPPPYVYSLQDQYVSYPDCLENNHECYGRRIWYLNIDATCASQMDFRNFPFDLQELVIDILNPYASRTWFQLTKGFLKEHIDEDISDINLSPDGKIPGWYVKNTTVSSSCLSTRTWQQTFWAQDNLLAGLADHGATLEPYERQHENITQALNPKELKCAIMENLHVETDDSPTNNKCYIIARDKYKERVDLALENYRKCMVKNNKHFYWNESVSEDISISIPDLGRNINTSQQNIYRSFSILDLEKGEQPSNVYILCAIEATSSLTTPGIRVSILVQRYIMFYVVKLILPTVACVAFTFSAFGLQPHQLMGRLTVVVPSAIALTALQGLVVSTDIPPVAYIAPSTYIILVSYFTQLLIAFESVLVRWIHDRNKKRKAAKASSVSTIRTRGAESKELAELRLQWVQIHRKTTTRNKTIIHTRSRLRPITLVESRTPIRRLDLLLMFGIGLLYTLIILLCTLLPWRRSLHLNPHYQRPGFISFWKDSSD